MKIRLFGKYLFEFNGKNSAEMYAVPAMATVEKMTHLPDFRTGGGDMWAVGGDLVQWASSRTLTITDTATTNAGGPTVFIKTAPAAKEMLFLDDL